MSGVGPEAHLKERKVEKLHILIDIKKQTNMQNKASTSLLSNSKIEWG
jgi:hypothetical protein